MLDASFELMKIAVVGLSVIWGHTLISQSSPNWDRNLTENKANVTSIKVILFLFAPLLLSYAVWCESAILILISTMLVMTLVIINVVQNLLDDFLSNLNKDTPNDN